MRSTLVVALIAFGLATTVAARAIYAPPIPDSESPAWLDDSTVRFESNFETRSYPLMPYVMAADGSGVRAATDAEARQLPASPPIGETLVFGSAGNPYGAPLFLVDAHGHRRLIESSAYALTPAALSPDGRIAVFAVWLGEHNAQSVTLYAVPTDGSSEPRRLTPTSCTGAAGGPLGGVCLDGTDRPDTLIGTKYGDLVIAGSGNDIIRPGDGDNWVEAQWGNDDIRTGSGSDWVWGGAGNDVIRTGGGRDHIYPGPGRDRVFAGAGPDIIVANDGERDVIDCGPGDDRAILDRLDLTRNCEHLTVAPPSSDEPPP